MRRRAEGQKRGKRREMDIIRILIMFGYFLLPFSLFCTLQKGNPLL
jgi:hypothetical protein